MVPLDSNTSVFSCFFSIMRLIITNILILGQSIQILLTFHRMLILPSFPILCNNSNNNDNHDRTNNSSNNKPREQKYFIKPYLLSTFDKIIVHLQNHLTVKLLVGFTRNQNEYHIISKLL